MSAHARRLIGSIGIGAFIIGGFILHPGVGCMFVGVALMILASEA